MKRLLTLLLLFITITATPVMVLAQGMMGSTGSPQVGTQSAVSFDGHTAREEAEGKEIWDKLQVKQLECRNLTDDHYGSLGEYFMGQMVGDSHEAMNTMMERMMGKVGEEQMHVVMGKRLSGCDVLPMMGYGSGNMMGQPFGVFGLLTWVVLFVFLMLGSMYFWKEIQRKK